MPLTAQRVEVNALRDALSDYPVIQTETIESLPPKTLYRIAKRMFDFVLALAASAVLLVPMAVIALVILLDSGGPVIYRQTRLGMGEKPFVIYKFRTMRRDAEEDGPRWADRDDGRCTRFDVTPVNGTSFADMPVHLTDYSPKNVVNVKSTATRAANGNISDTQVEYDSMLTPYYTASAQEINDLSDDTNIPMSDKDTLHVMAWHGRNQVTDTYESTYDISKTVYVNTIVEGQFRQDADGEVYLPYVMDQTGAQFTCAEIQDQVAYTSALYAGTGVTEAQRGSKIDIALPTVADGNAVLKYFTTDASDANNVRLSSDAAAYDAALTETNTDTFAFGTLDRKAALEQNDVVYHIFYNGDFRYTVRWLNADGSVLEQDDGLRYNAQPSYDGAAPVREGGEFIGWTPEIKAVTGDCDYTAVFTDTQQEKKNGLIPENGELWWYVDGEKVGAGLIEVDGYYYYIRPNGAAVRGTDYYVSKTNGLKPVGMYTFGPDGKMVIKDDIKNGLVWEEDGLWYYVDGLRTRAGLIYVDGYYYYIKSNGGAVLDQSYYVSNTNNHMARAMHSFDDKGRMTDVPVVKNGLYEENGHKYYYVDDVKTHAGLIEWEGNYYYINSSCYAVTNCDYYVSNTNGFVKPGTYHFNDDGKMVVPEQDTRTGLFEENGELVYYVNGEKTHAGLIEWEGHYYYIKSNCTAVRDSDYYVSNTNNLMPRGTYHFDADGRMVP